MKKEQYTTKKNKIGDFKGNYPPCKQCGKLGHPPFKCWEGPDANCTKYNQLGHEVIICKNKTQHQDAEARVVDEQEEDQLFVASYLTSSVSSESCLIDSGCTNHMACDKDLFKDLRPTKVTKVRIVHGGYISTKRTGTITIETQSGTKIISGVLYVPNLDQNLLSVEERRFHPLCVESPLLKEAIPPDDDGWLCPGCDCKVDCIDFLNDLQGIDFSATDSWEKVYPKEAVAFGEKLDDISGLPSDDSENGLPDIPCPNEVSAKHLGEEMSSPEHDLEDRKPNMVLSGNNYGLARRKGLCPLNGFQNMTHLESDSECKLYLESNISVQRKQMPETANADKLSELELENVYDEQRENATQSAELPLPSNSRTSAALQEIQKIAGSSSTEEKLKVGAIDYGRLPKDATLKDVVTVIRADEAHHRDVNHFASPWETYQADLSIDLSKHHVPMKFLDKVVYWCTKNGGRYAVTSEVVTQVRASKAKNWCLHFIKQGGVLKVALRMQLLFFFSSSFFTYNPS
ncbi:putative TMV resistance protein N-like [Capsicum annuum]|nr:putative TMV resistance protein N-like [Capsicum annuum]